MFIHWGLYSIPAGTWQGKTYGGASEWLLNTAKIPIEDWLPLQKQFNPTEFDAKKIVSIAKLAGMKYIVITSKHHEGFAMYPSKIGTWNIGNTAFSRDPLKELSEECKRQGILFCTYHSILDWHHPDYLPNESYDKRPKIGADFERYVKTMKGQLKEIIERYDPAVMWFDGEWQNTWNHERGVDLYNYCRSLKPDMIINNRVDVGRAGMSGFSPAEMMGDFGTPEQEIPANGVNSDWESCTIPTGNQQTPSFATSRIAPRKAAITCSTSAPMPVEISRLNPSKGFQKRVNGYSFTAMRSTERPPVRSPER
jgi:alpha-L-fucosidase